MPRGLPTTSMCNASNMWCIRQVQQRRPACITTYHAEVCYRSRLSRHLPDAPYKRPFPEAPAMRVPRVRFTMRRMMLAVVVLALLIWPIAEHMRHRLWERSDAAACPLPGYPSPDRARRQRPQPRGGEPIGRPRTVARWSRHLLLPPRPAQSARGRGEPRGRDPVGGGLWLPGRQRSPRGYPVFIVGHDDRMTIWRAENRITRLE